MKLNSQLINDIANNIVLPLLFVFVLVLAFLFFTIPTANAAGVEEIPDIALNWSEGTLREDGSAVQNRAGYKLYQSINGGAEIVTNMGPTESGLLLVDATPGQHVFKISTLEQWPDNGPLLEGRKSQAVTVDVPAPPSPPGEIVIRATLEICINGECEIMEINP